MYRVRVRVRVMIRAGASDPPHEHAVRAQQGCHGLRRRCLGRLSRTRLGLSGVASGVAAAGGSHAEAA